MEAVFTTGIYCRAECSARPLSRNTARYPSSVAAEAAGYRPCLRCRPERRAGSLAGLDAPEPVAAALLRITDGYLDDHDEAALASQVGYSARHLRRLFELHIGATPSAIARSRRAHFARRLIDETDLSFDAIARAAGLGGARQLHRAVTSIFGFTPSQLRSKRRRGQQPGIGSGLVLTIPYIAPFNFNTFLAHHAPRAIPGIESTDGAYVRSISVCGHGGIAEVVDAADGEHLRLRLHLPTYDSIIDDAHRARTLLGTDADPARAAVLNEDPVIGPLMRAAPGLRVPRSWDRFETVVRIVAGQQVSVAVASTLCGRLAQRLGVPIAVPGDTAAAGTDTGADTGADANSDKHRDTGTDANRDKHRDTGTDANRDKHRDTSTDANRDKHRDTGTDANRDKGNDTGTDANRGEGGDTNTDTGTDANSDKGGDGSHGRASQVPQRPVSGRWPTHLFPSAAALADAGACSLGGLGFTQRRVDAIIGVARAVSSGDLDLKAANSLDDTVAQLCELDGIGPWSAHLIAMRVFGHDDAFPASDLGLRRAVEHLTGQPCSAHDLLSRAESWRPYRSWAAQHLWHSAATRRANTARPISGE